MTELTIFYDGYCPLCVKEMRKLAALDKNALLNLQDIQASDFAQRFPRVNPAEANRVLLGLDKNGHWLRGLDVSLRAWTLVGQGWRVAPLRWRWLRPLLDRGYRFFARNRYKISGLLTGQRRCRHCQIRSDS